MFPPDRDYSCICHVCGKKFIVTATFLRSPQVFHEGKTGKDYIVTTCRTIDKNAHTQMEVRQSFLKGGNAFKYLRGVTV
jgi:hypothetical protein